MTDPILTYFQMYSAAFTWEQFHEIIFVNLIRYIYSYITLLNHIPQLSGPHAVTLVNKKAKLLNDLYMYQSNSYVSH